MHRHILLHQRISNDIVEMYVLSLHDTEIEKGKVPLDIQRRVADGLFQ